MPARTAGSMDQMDDFQRAAAAAQAHYTEEAWTALPTRVQSQAIYAELSRIDAERVAAAAFATRRRFVLQPRMAQGPQVPAAAE